ncbi:MAG: CoA-acylating methylmalonate-semialdehyde dehydrogenase [Rhodothermaceae bacterium]|nr:CoA-acylating methylmalonate-semialdehyde dehydrogenase [Rhodothermaceae bacterium]
MNSLPHYIDGAWKKSGGDTLAVDNPATLEVIANVPLGTSAEVNEAVKAAAAAFPEWRNTPTNTRIQYLFKLKMLLEDHVDEIAQLITLECGKTLAESRGELRRAIENVEVACGMPVMIQSEFSEDIARGIDEYMIRQPLGVCACIAPFNFPGMIPFWFLPYAIACGNTFIVKPSEKVPLTMAKVFELIEQLDLPAGVLNMVHGGRDVVDTLLEHPEIKAISFVGSTPVARYVYERAAKFGKRVQAQGGAKNPIIILPDADPDMTTKIVTDSVYGCAGQRCLAASMVVTVGNHSAITDQLVDAARSRVTGNGLDEGVQMGPVITPQSKQRIESIIQEGVSEGAKLVLDGRQGARDAKGNFIAPTILKDIPLDGKIVRTEIFGPVMGLVHLDSIDEAIQFVNSGEYGNMACIFTSSGANARRFRHDVQAGNVGINIGVAAPMAQFPFSGWKSSFFGDLHGQSRHAVEFFTQTKVVVERWLDTWSRTF